MKKILFLHQGWTGFEERDWEILNENFCAEDLRFYKDTFFRIPHWINSMRNVDVVFCWFAYRAALIPLLFAKFFKKKIILVVGGWDCANAPEIRYGAFRKGLRFFLTRAITRYVITLADRIIAVSEFNRQEIIVNGKVSPDRVSMIYHGIPLCGCAGAEKREKERIVLTVGKIIENNLKRKGLATFIKAAAILPEVKFFLVGHLDERMARYIKDSVTDNVIITGRMSREKLCELYSRAKVYVQVSYHEQFGCSLAEAMAHECVPVVTKRSALPEVVGQAGYYVPYDDAGELSRAIMKAFDDTQTGILAQKRVKELFSFAARKQAIRELIEQTCRE